jgi:transcriptional regulator with XRE-family HTH domain
MLFNEKIVKLRKKKGWSQSELGQRINVHIAHLSRLENNKSQPSVDMLSKIAKVFHVTMDYLMNEDEDEIIPITINDKTLAERVELLDQLDKSDRQTIINVMDSMLAKKKMLDLLTNNVMP